MTSSSDKQSGLPQGRALTPHDEQFRDDQQGIYDTLRLHAPRYRDIEYGRTLLTTFADVRAAVRDKRCSVNAKYSREDSYMRRIAATGLDVREGETAYEPPLVLLDDPDHRRIRGLMAKAFTPRAVEGMRVRVIEVAATLLNDLEGKSEVDLIHDYAGPLPTQTILDMMGMGDASTTDFKGWSEDILMGYDPERGQAIRERLRTAYVSMSREFKRIVEARRVNEGDDLISAMVYAQDDEERLSDLEIISLCTQLMVAGNVTTSDLIGNGLFALMTNPESQKRLSDDLSLVEDAVEEMLRFDCPIAETGRIAKEDFDLNGCPVKAGDTITAALSAANHDPERFSNPHLFDIVREDNQHLAFGHGVHVCLGASLARLEAQVAIGALLERHPDVSLHPDIEPVRRELPFFSGFTSLTVRLS